MRRQILAPLFAAVVLVAGTLLLWTAGAAQAHEPGPPDYGQKNNPAGVNCPDFLPGVEKCHPLGWFGPDHAVSDHQVVVTDPLLPPDGDGTASGWVNFTCRSLVGFKYMVGATGLDPWSEYGVQGRNHDGTIYDLGVMRTDADGSDHLRGVLRLEPGSYELAVEIVDASGTVVLTGEDDPAGFGVFEKPNS